MFLHLGGDTVIPLKNVIAITDLKNERSAINSEFIKKMSEARKIIDVADGHGKSFVVADKVVYLSAISSVTLKKRAGNIPDIEDD